MNSEFYLKINVQKLSLRILGVGDVCSSPESLKYKS